MTINDTIIGVLLHDIGKIVQRASPHRTYEDHVREGISFLENILSPLPPYRIDTIFAVVGGHHEKIRNPKSIPQTPFYANIIEVARLSDWLSAAERLLLKGGKINRIPRIPLLSVFTEVSGIRELSEKCELFFYDNVRPVEIDPFAIEFPFPTLTQKEILYNGKLLGDVNNKILAGYRSILNSLKKYLDKLVRHDLLREDTLLIVLEKSLSFAPSDTGFNPDMGILPDISLYDHLRIAASFARAMLNYLVDNGIDIEKQYASDELQKIKDSDVKPFLIIKGDISGVQNFIYSVGTKWALKLLRARSLYLELLAEDVITEILDRLELGRSNLIYSGGGHFIIVAQNTENAIRTLEKIKTEINIWLYERFGGALALILVWEPAGYSDFIVKNREKCPNIVEILEKKLPGKIEHEKMRKFVDIFAKEPDRCIIPEYYEQCFSCRSLVPRDQLMSIAEFKKKYYGAKEEELEPFDHDRMLCDFCRMLIILGEALILSAFFLRIPKSEEAKKLIDKSVFEKQGIAYLELPFSYFLFPKAPQALKDKEQYSIILGMWFRDTVELLDKYEIPSGYLYLKNLLDIPDQLLRHSNLLQRYNLIFFPVGDYVTINEKALSVKSIDDIVERAYGPKWAGALRLDVDWLGRVFMKGLKGRICRYTFSRYATLSRFLNYFFKLIIPYAFNAGINVFQHYLKPHKYDIIRLQGKVGGDTQPVDLGIIPPSGKMHELTLVYSGGDDVFLVGAWDHVINASLIIDALFRAFVANNPHLTLSAGVSIFDRKYPVLRASIEAGELEDISKKVPDKNSLTILNQTFHWNDFRYAWRKLLESGILIRSNEKLELGIVSKSFLRNILFLLQATYREVNKKDLIPIDNIYAISYCFGRRLSTIKNLNAKKRLEELYQFIKQNVFELSRLKENLPPLISALMLIDLLTRS